MEAILRVIAGGQGRRMQMMYGAYLSYEQLEEYAAFMIEDGLVYKERGTELYQLTTKGAAFLRAGEVEEVLSIAPKGPRASATAHT